MKKVQGPFCVYDSYSYLGAFEHLRPAITCAVKAAKKLKAWRDPDEPAYTWTDGHDTVEILNKSCEIVLSSARVKKNIERGWRNEEDYR